MNADLLSAPMLRNEATIHMSMLAMARFLVMALMLAGVGAALEATHADCEEAGDVGKNKYLLF